ncbi:hypothetical protein Csa_004568 [Cucumis sativus]|nr:hypothetical protein Csa_004568 [Cucumis sativus]
MYGIGGIGKTTLAKDLYNKIATQFERCCFLQDVRREASKQYGLVQLHETLLCEILKEDLKVVNCDKGINIIRSRLCLKKVLIVFDDVDHHRQLEALVGELDWFGRGSKIIMLTRNGHLLSSHGFDEKHKIHELDQDHALVLFSWHALKKNHPSSSYIGLSESATNYCKGLSVALVVLGSFLREKILDFSAASNLEELYLTNCTNLGMLDKSILSLNKLTVLNFEGCSNLKMLSRGYFMLSSLKELRPSYYKKLEKIPDLSAASNLKRLYLQECTNLRVIHKSVGSLDKLGLLDLSQCTNLVKLPSYLRSLEDLPLSGCSIFEMFPHKWDPTIHPDLTLGEISREFILTGIEIPEWFSYKTTSNLVTASFRHYPDMERTLAAGVSFKVNGDPSKRGARISCNIFICNKLYCSFSRSFLPSKSEHIWLVTTSLEWGSMEVNDWNKVLVWFEVHKAHGVTITRYGVHVTEQLHGIQTDIKWPMVNYADFYQLEKLQSL